MEINHIGITVPDLDAAVAFYVEVFGLRVLVEPGLHTDQTAFADRRRDVFGDHWGAMKLAHLVTPSGCGIELFEFVKPATHGPDVAFDYARVGVSHICLTTEDLDGAIARLVERGGSQRSAVHKVRDGVSVCYCADPWGVIIELSSASYSGIVGVA